MQNPLSTLNSALQRTAVGKVTKFIFPNDPSMYPNLRDDRVRFAPWVLSAAFFFLQKSEMIPSLTIHSDRPLTHTYRWVNGWQVRDLRKLLFISEMKSPWQQCTACGQPCEREESKVVLEIPRERNNCLPGKGDLRPVVVKNSSGPSVLLVRNSPSRIFRRNWGKCSTSSFSEECKYICNYSDSWRSSRASIIQRRNDKKSTLKSICSLWSTDHSSEGLGWVEQKIPQYLLVVS